jgi:ribonucleoside-diphosphate reductase beta chain
MWTDREFSFLSDVGNFHNEMTEKQRGILLRTMAAIAQIEVKVKTFWGRLGIMFPCHEMIDLGFVLANSEVIHGKAYKRVLDELNMHSFFRQALETEVFNRRVEYLNKHAERTFGDDRTQLVYSLILFTIFVENISLFTPFYIGRHFFAKHGLMKDIDQQITYTAQEETLHAYVGVSIIRTLREEHPELFTPEMTERIYAQCREALLVENDLISWLLEGYEDEGLSEAHMRAFVADRMRQSIELIELPVTEEFKLDDQQKKLLEETDWFYIALKSILDVDFFQQRYTSYSKSRTFDAGTLARGLIELDQR